MSEDAVPGLVDDEQVGGAAEEGAEVPDLPHHLFGHAAHLAAVGEGQCDVEGTGGDVGQEEDGLLLAGRQEELQGGGEAREEDTVRRPRLPAGKGREAHQR